MNKCIVCICISLFLGLSAKADHITGGEMYYSFSGMSGNLFRYNGTLKLFMRCNSGRRFNDPTVISVFNKANNTRVTDLSVKLSRTETISLANSDPCISNPPTVCYEVGYFDFSIELPASSGGYILSSQVNYRINGISNLSQGYSQVGALYTAEIPGNAPVVTGQENSSANFVGSDLVIVCANNHFNYSFAARDADGDQLKYSFCEAYQSNGNVGGPGNAGPTQPPPYNSVPYGVVYSGGVPLGSGVQINPNTGLITGIAPSTGVYVVTVCVQEIRNGIVIATQRKDLQINIAPCQVAAALLEPEYQLCKSSRTITFQNISTSPLINTTFWELVDASGTVIFSSTLLTPTYTFSDTGLYTIKLAINRSQRCSDSTSATVRVYPGLISDFSVAGVCVNKPSLFNDLSSVVYGTINSWNWDFGELSVGNDVSTVQKPVYSYPSQGSKLVELVIGTSKGCSDTVTKTIAIVDKPPLLFAFRDTLICIPDAVQLHAGGSGTYSWAPAAGILNGNTPDPTVSPRTTTKYYATLNDNGCVNTDSVVVRVTDRVTLQAMPDTIICSNDSIQLRVVSDALSYSWTPASQVSNGSGSSAIAVTPATTLYQVTGRIGSCSAVDQVLVTAIPYPVANAGPDVTICFNSSMMLMGKSDASSFMWFPATNLSSSTTLTPVAKPRQTTTYQLFAYDNKGCPKPGTDSVHVKVLADIKAFAGNDTMAITGQPLQLQASGGTSYTWTPAVGLSNISIANPVAMFVENTGSIRYKVLVYEEGCVDSAFLNVRLFNTGPTVFVPTAFTPNADGKNDRLRPIAVGIKAIDYFTVYNRWGGKVFNTVVNGYGWDGTINGVPQGSGTFVWMVKATDYNGKPYFQKGTVLLIR